MTAVEPAPKAHKIGAPIMLTQEDIDRRRARIIAKYGTAEELKRMDNLIGLTWEQREALHQLGDLDFLEGKEPADIDD